MESRERVPEISAKYNPNAPRPAAGALRAFRLQFEPKSVAGIKAEQRTQQESAGTPLKTLRAIEPVVRRDPERILPLLIALGRTCLTWQDADQLATVQSLSGKEG